MADTDKAGIARLEQPTFWREHMGATVVTLPLLTIVSDFVGLCGGFVVGAMALGLAAARFVSERGWLVES